MSSLDRASFERPEDGRRGDPLPTGGPCAGENGGAPPPAHAAPRPRVASLLLAGDPLQLGELHRFWSPGRGRGEAEEPASGEMRERLRRWMLDPELAEARVAALGKRLRAVLAAHLEAHDYHCAVADLAARRELAHLSSYELEAALCVLVRAGLLVEWPDRRFKSFGARAHAIPLEVGDGLLRQERARRRGIFDVLTLRGFLDRQYDDPARKQRIAPTRLRELYKMYASESGSALRIERLPSELRAVVEKAILQFGGLLSRAQYEHTESGGVPWHGPAWREALESSLVGTVERLELSRFGIQHADEALIVFNEVALAWLRRVAVPGDPDRPHGESALGVDLVSNVTRFVGFIVEHSVRFTMRGEIFKTTEKRILQELIENPGRELSREEVLDFIYGFARDRGLIESTGERTFALTAEGRVWEQNELEKKLAVLLEHALEERGLPGDPYHQVRLRRIFLRLLKRVEPMVWYDLMYLPFLSRNTYLAGLDPLAADEYFGSRLQSGHAPPMDDPQRMSWNLARWVRTRLYLLGIVDLGYDPSGRPVAVRLTRIGARALGAAEAPAPPAGAVGSLIVTPDFEVVLFKTGDDAALVHELDRFCERETMGEALHFRISDRSIQRALSEGVYLARVLDTLRTHSRTPVPQNVLYSIRDWASRAGVMQLSGDLVLSADDPECLRKVLRDPAARGLVREALDERRVQLKTRFTARRAQALLRDLGFLVELG